MAMLGGAVALMLVLTGLASVQGCVYLYGSRHEAAANSTHFTYAYVGLDWPEEFATCSGAHQSPIHVPGHTALNRLTDDEATSLTFGKISSNGSNILLINNGHTVQVKTPTDWRPDASVVYKGPAASATLTSKFSTTASGSPGRVKIRPAQFHFHTRSEHVIGGKEYPLEMHIVNYVYNDTLTACGGGGCITVVGIMFQLADNDTAAPNPFLEAVFSQMSLSEGTTVPLPANVTLDFDQVLPADRSYVTYEGSLTTPPCTENILWHVLTTPVQITKAQLHQFELAVGETDCNTTTQPSQTGIPPTTRKLTTSSSDTDSAFEEPAWAVDPVDNETCHKIVGQNYREVQYLKSRPIYFHAQGVCDKDLAEQAGKFKKLGTLLYPSGNNKTMTLAQYDAIVAADMSSCAAVTSAANVHEVGGSMLQLLVLGFASVIVLLGI